MIKAAIILILLMPPLFIIWLIGKQKSRKAALKKLSRLKTRHPVDTRPLALSPKKGKNTLPFLKSLEYLLISAKISISPQAFILIPVLVTLSAALLVLFITGKIITLPMIIIPGIALPALYLYFKKKQIERAIIEEMPEAIGMIVRALQVGYPVDRALKDAARNLDGPMGTELKIVYQETAMGFSFEQALRNFIKRYPLLTDVTLFCTAFIIQRETGGNLIGVLDSLADTIRKRFIFQKKVKTFSAEARLSAIIISLMPLIFIVFAVIFNPAYISRLTETPDGRFLAWLAVGLEVTGFIAMYRMTRVRM